MGLWVIASGSWERTTMPHTSAINLPAPKPGSDVANVPPGDFDCPQLKPFCKLRLFHRKVLLSKLSAPQVASVVQSTGLVALTTFRLQPGGSSDCRGGIRREPGQRVQRCRREPQRWAVDMPDPLSW